MQCTFSIIVMGVMASWLLGRVPGPSLNLNQVTYGPCMFTFMYVCCKLCVCTSNASDGLSCVCCVYVVVLDADLVLSVLLYSRSLSDRRCVK